MDAAPNSKSALKKVKGHGQKESTHNDSEQDTISASLYLCCNCRETVVAPWLSSKATSIFLFELMLEDVKDARRILLQVLLVIVIG